MTLTDILAKHAIENNDLLNDLQLVLDEIQTASSENQIPKSRFDEVISQRNELREEVRELQLELEGYKRKLKGFEDLNVEALQEELEGLRVQVQESRRKRWEEYERFFEVPEDDPRYMKMLRIRDDFRFGTDTEPLSPDDINHNLQTIKPYLKAGYFEKEQTYDSARPIQGIKPCKRTDLTEVFKAFGG